MPRDGNGNYTLPAGNPVVNGTVIDPTVQNNTMSDVATALTDSVTRDGQSPLTANMPMGGFKQTNLGTGSVLTDSANLGQIQNQAYLWGGVATGTANALSVALSPLPSAWAVGQRFRFKAGASPNSGATTIAITGGPAAIAVQVKGAACVGGEIQANQFYEVFVDSATTCQLTAIGAIAEHMLDMVGAVNEAQTTVASATTPDIWTNTGNIISYTGTTTATGFAAAPQAGARRVLDCAAAAVFTAGANMLIDGIASGSNLTVAAGDRVEVYARTTTQFVLRQVRADGAPVIPVTPIVGSKNLKCTIATASASATFTADEVVVESALGGTAYKLGSYSQALNLATVGAGGMDTGTAPVSGFIAVYAIAKPGGTTPSILACNVSTSSGSVYSGLNMPAGYTLSALLAILPTNASSQFYPAFVQDSKISLTTFIAAATGQADTATLTSQSISSGVPTVAKSVSLFIGTTASGTAIGASVASDSTGTGLHGLVGVGATAAGRSFGGSATVYANVALSDIPIITSQTVYVELASGGANKNIYVTGYTW